MSNLRAASKDPRYGGVTCLTTSAVLAFVMFIHESFAFKAVFATALATGFAAINLATFAAVLPMSRVAADEARRARVILIWSSLAVVCGAIVGWALR